MAVLKLILIAVALLGIAMAGFAIKLFFQKNGQTINTSCGAVGSDLEKRGVDACATGSCSNEKKEECKSEKRIEVEMIKLT